MPFTRSQIDRLGERLRRSGGPDAKDLALLFEYEREFDAARRYVVDTIRSRLGREPTARPKTRSSVVAKLNRGTALSRMQDIAGCRLVVEDMDEQDDVVDRLRDLPWDSCEVVDRRLQPSHGYRAVHLIVGAQGHVVEVQVRSRLQDLWAQISEKLADRYGLEVKYGGGRADVQELLRLLSILVARIEELDQAVSHALDDQPTGSAEEDPELIALQDEYWAGRREIAELLQGIVDTLTS